MKTLILFFSMFSHRDTIPEIIVYTDMTKKTVKGYSYIDTKGNKILLSSTKKKLPDEYRVEFPSSVPLDTLKAGWGIAIDTISPHNFLIRIDTSLIKK